jgi:hypothetical protein
VLDRLELAADDTLLCTSSVEMDRAEPWLDDATGGLCWDLMVCSSTPFALRCTTSGDAVPTTGFSGAMGIRTVSVRFPRLTVPT